MFSILFAIIHGLYIGGVFFKRGEEVLIDLEDSQSYIHNEVENVRTVISDFSQNIDHIVQQQAHLNQKNNEAVGINTQLTETISQLSDSFEGQKAEIAELRQSVDNIQTAPPSMQQAAPMQPAMQAPIIQQQEIQKKAEPIQSQPVPPAPKPQDVPKVQNISSEELLSEDFDENTLPGFLDEDDDASFDLKEDFFLDGMSEEFSEATHEKRDLLEQNIHNSAPNIQTADLEAEEFADVTDILHNNSPQQAREVASHAALQEEEFLDEEFMTVSEDILETSPHEETSLLEEEFADHTLSTEDSLPTSHVIFDDEEFIDDLEGGLEDALPIISEPQEHNRPVAQNPMDIDEAPLPSLRDLLPATTELAQRKGAYAPQNNDLPSLDNILAETGHKNTAAMEEENEAVDMSMQDIVTEADDEESKESVAERLDHIPVMQQKEMDGDVHAAIRALQEQAKMDIPEAQPDIQPENIVPEVAQAAVADIQAEIDASEEFLDIPDETISLEEGAAEEAFIDEYVAEVPQIPEQDMMAEPQEAPVPQQTEQAMADDVQNIVPQPVQEDIIPEPQVAPIIEQPQQNISIPAEPEADLDVTPDPTIMAVSEVPQTTVQSVPQAPNDARSRGLIFADAPPEDMVQALRYALEHNAIDTCIRAVLDPINQAVCFLEGVNYMRDEEGYYHPPTSFAHDASKLGLDKTIDQILVTRIIQTIRALSNIGKNLRIFTNISVQTLCDDSFEEELFGYGSREK